MTIAAYQTLYESSIAFGMRKALQAEQGKADMEARIKQLEGLVPKVETTREALDARHLGHERAPRAPGAVAADARGVRGVVHRALDGLAHLPRVSPREGEKGEGCQKETWGGEGGFGARPRWRSTPTERRASSLTPSAALSDAAAFSFALAASAAIARAAAAIASAVAAGRVRRHVAWRLWPLGRRLPMEYSLTMWRNRASHQHARLARDHRYESGSDADDRYPRLR